MPPVTEAQLRQSNASAADKARLAAPRKGSSPYRSARYSGTPAEVSFLRSAEAKARAELAREAAQRDAIRATDWHDCLPASGSASGVTTPNL